MGFRGKKMNLCQSSEIHSKMKKKEKEEDEGAGRSHGFSCVVTGEAPASNKAPLEEASH